VFWKIIIILGGLLFIGLLITSIIYPLLKKQPKDVSVEVHKKTPASIDQINIPSYQRIAIALDFNDHDQQLIASALGQANGLTKIIFIHIVESASAKILGSEADDYETRHDQEKLDRYVSYLKEKGITAESKLGFRNRNKEIPRLVKEAGADLLIIGAHGHSGVKDWLYGETIDAVRHQLKIPVLIVSG
jgi:manganese transport protein